MCSWRLLEACGHPLGLGGGHGSFGWTRDGADVSANVDGAATSTLLLRPVSRISRPLPTMRCLCARRGCTILLLPAVVMVVGVDGYAKRILICAGKSDAAPKFETAGALACAQRCSDAGFSNFGLECTVDFGLTSAFVRVSSGGGPPHAPLGPSGRLLCFIIRCGHPCAKFSAYFLIAIMPFGNDFDIVAPTLIASFATTNASTAAPRRAV